MLWVPVFDVSPWRPWEICSGCKWKMIFLIPGPVLEIPAGFFCSSALPGQKDISAGKWLLRGVSAAPLQTFSGYAPTQAIFTNDITFKWLRDMNLRCLHKQVHPFHKIPSHSSAVFSLVSSDYTLKTILFWILPFQSPIPLAPEKSWVVGLCCRFSTTYHLILFGGLWCFAVSLIAVGSFY